MPSTRSLSLYGFVVLSLELIYLPLSSPTARLTKASLSQAGPTTIQQAAPRSLATSLRWTLQYIPQT